MWIQKRAIALVVLVGLAAAACGGYGSGTAWGDGAFRSNGERIYFTASSERGSEIDHTGGPDVGGMMMTGRLSCASCHGADARGGRHAMHMDVMDAPSIRWVALSGPGDEGHEDDGAGDDDHGVAYDLETFTLAVTEGRHPDGRPLSLDMPRWEMSEEDMRDLAEFLGSFPAP